MKNLNTIDKYGKMEEVRRRFCTYVQVNPKEFKTKEEKYIFRRNLIDEYMCKHPFFMPSYIKKTPIPQMLWIKYWLWLEIDLTGGMIDFKMNRIFQSTLVEDFGDKGRRMIFPFLGELASIVRHQEEGWTQRYTAEQFDAFARTPEGKEYLFNETSIYSKKITPPSCPRLSEAYKWSESEEGRKLLGITSEFSSFASFWKVHVSSLL